MPNQRASDLCHVNSKTRLSTMAEHSEIGSTDEILLCKQMADRVALSV